MYITTYVTEKTMGKKFEDTPTKKRLAADIRLELHEALTSAAHELTFRTGEEVTKTNIVEWSIREWLDRNFTGGLDKNVLQSFALEVRHQELFDDMKKFFASGDERNIQKLCHIFRLLLAREREDAQG